MIAHGMDLWRQLQKEDSITWNATLDLLGIGKYNPQSLCLGLLRNACRKLSQQNRTIHCWIYLDNTDVTSSVFLNFTCTDFRCKFSLTQSIYWNYYNNIFQWKVYLLAPYISQIIFKYKRWKYILFTESFAVKFLEKDCINGTVCRHESVLFELYYNFLWKCLKAYGGKSIWTRMEELDEAREDGRNGLRGTSFAWSQ